MIKTECKSTRRPTPRLALQAAGILSIAFALGCEPAEPPTVPQVQASAPDAPAAAAESASLPQVDLAGLEALIEETAAQDKVLVVDFWATWCAPCVAMLPKLHEAAEGWGEDVRLVTVTLDVPGETEAPAIEFLEKHHATSDAYLLVPDVDKRLAVPTTLGQQWTDLVVPAVLVYDRTGRLVGEHLDGNPQPIIEDVSQRIREAS